MDKISAFAPAAAGRVPFCQASETFRLHCKAQNLTPLTRDWYEWRLKGIAPQHRFGDSLDHGHIPQQHCHCPATSHFKAIEIDYL